MDAELPIKLSPVKVWGFCCGSFWTKVFDLVGYGLSSLFWTEVFVVVGSGLGFWGLRAAAFTDVSAFCVMFS